MNAIKPLGARLHAEGGGDETENADDLRERDGFEVAEESECLNEHPGRARIPLDAFALVVDRAVAGREVLRVAEGMKQSSTTRGK